MFLKPMHVILILLFFLITSLLSQCSDGNSSSKTAEKPKYYIRYFREKKISSRNQFRHIDITFEKEISGSSDELIHSLKAIEKDKESFYKVYYFFSNKIYKYELIEQGYLKAYAEYEYEYEYGKISTLKAGKIEKIKYFNKNRELIAYDTIIYNKFGWPIRTRRYTMPEKKLNNIF